MATVAHRHAARTGSDCFATTACRQSGIQTDFEDDFEDITPRASPQRAYSHCQKISSGAPGLINTGWRRSSSSSENESACQHRDQMNEKWHRKRRDITPRSRPLDPSSPTYELSPGGLAKEAVRGKLPHRLQTMTMGPLVTQWHGRKRRRHLTNLSLYDKLVFIAFFVSFVVFLRALCGAGESTTGHWQSYRDQVAPKENPRSKAGMYGIDRKSLRSSMKHDPHAQYSVDIEGHYSFALDTTLGHNPQTKVGIVTVYPGTDPVQSTPARTESMGVPSLESVNPVSTLAFSSSKFASPTPPTALSLDWRWADYERYGLDFPDHPVRIHLADQPIAQLPIRRGRHGVKARLGLR